MFIQIRDSGGSHNLLIKEGKNLIETRGLAPVAHEITDNTEQTHECNTSLLHATVGILREANIESTAGISVGEDFIPSVDKREGEKRGAW